MLLLFFIFVVAVVIEYYLLVGFFCNECVVWGEMGMCMINVKIRDIIMFFLNSNLLNERGRISFNNVAFNCYF